MAIEKRLPKGVVFKLLLRRRRRRRHHSSKVLWILPGIVLQCLVLMS